VNWTLHLGDCLEGMATLADGSVDHVITDPPYEAEAHTLQRRTPLGNGHGKSKAEDKPLDFEPITPELRFDSSSAFGRLVRRWVLVFCQAEAVGEWRFDLSAARLKWKRSCIWVKPDAQPQLTGDRPGTGYESIACAHALGARSRWNGGGSVGVFTANRNHVGSRPSHHMSEKPLALMETLISLFTDPGDLILDPFAGSGTTGVAAIRLGRRFIGYEKDPKYHAIAVKRLEAAREQMTIPATHSPKMKQENLQMEHEESQAVKP
jgi:site-specific DNA-methyltransferase (adenine-specific)